MSSRFTPAQRAEIMAEARANVADAKSTSSRFTPAQRAEILAEARAHVAQTTKPDAQRDERTIVYKTAPVEVQLPPAVRAVANSEQVWWQWVEERIAACFDTLTEATGAALGEMIGKVRDEIEQHAATSKRELELLRREFTVLRDEVGVEHQLRDLRTQVVKAQRSIPKVPAIEARLRAEANIARGETDQEFAKLRRDLKETQRLLVSLQVKHAKLPATLERVLEQVQESFVEYEEYEERYEQHSTRTVFRPTMSNEAAMALRVFAAKVLGVEDGAIVEH